MQSQPEYLLIGLGASGLATAKFLASQGIAFNLADTRENPPNLAEFTEAFPTAQLTLGKLTLATTQGYQYIVTSPGISIATPAIQQAVAAGAQVMGDIELFCRYLQQQNQPVPSLLAITGSNGKTSVTSLVGEMLRAAGLVSALGGNLGIPVLQYLTPQEPIFSQDLPEAFALELSSFQLETTFSLAATAAIFLNFSPDHLDRYPSLEAYRQAKLKIFNQAKIAIYNRADLATRPHNLNSSQQVISFGLDAPPTEQDFGVLIHQGVSYLAQGKQLLMPTSEVKLAGQQGLENTLAALALCLSLELPLAPLRQAAANFTGLAHRCEFIAQVDGVTYFNDSKATNLGAMQAAVTSLFQQDKGLWLILGGDTKGQDFSQLGQFLAGKVKGVALIGSSKLELAAKLEGACPYFIAQDLTSAVQQLAAQAQPQDTVLLSPACASWDEFKNFEHRGEVFQQAVAQLMQAT